jgi:hypothetical protein
MQFSTINKIFCNDGLKGGWWFNDCYNVFLNGPYNSTEWLGVWEPLVPFGTQVARTKMMIRTSWIRSKKKQSNRKQN